MSKCILKKVAYKSEPKLHVHKYVVQITKGKTRGYWYCTSLKEVKERALGASDGAIIEVYSAAHNFLQAYQKSTKK